MGYFTKEIKPTIAASKQHAGTIVAGDVLFDWTSFDIPRGGAKLEGVTVLVRPKGDAGPTPNNFPISLIFGKEGTDAHKDLTSTSSIGDPGDVAFLAGKLTNAIIGSIEIATADYIGPDSAISTSCLSVATSSPVGSLILDSKYNSATRTGANSKVVPNDGYDRYYVAGIANGTFDFQSINAIAEDTDASHANSQVITMDGTSMDCQEHFIDGDVVHIGTTVGTPAVDSLIGTIASADSTTQITLDAVSPTELVDGDILYNIHPVRLILHFENRT